MHALIENIEVLDPRHVEDAVPLHEVRHRTLYESITNYIRSFFAR